MRRVKAAFQFIKHLVRKASDDSIMELANGLTYRVLLAFFPFIVFLMTFLGFLELDDSDLINRLYGVLPPDIFNLINRFLKEVFHTQNHGLLSTSLFFTVFNAANGFREAMRCLNHAYGLEDERNIIKKVGISLLLMLTFSASIASMLILLIFSGNIWKILGHHLPAEMELLYRMVSTSFSMVALTLGTMFIYKLACVKRLKLKSVFPGACVTVLLWLVSSKGFNFFIANYSNYSVLYGSIAGVFVLIFWG